MTPPGGTGASSRIPTGRIVVAAIRDDGVGAAPGTAVEAFGPSRLTRVIGRDRGDLLVTRDFRLE